MESLKSFRDHLENLRSRAKKLAETELALNALFAGEETRLEWEHEVSVLQEVRRSIVEHLQRLKQTEASASLGHSEANLALFPVGLALTAMFSKNNLPSAIADYLRRGPGDRHRPFGKVIVCIGPKGLLDDAKAISISQSARESNRTEPEIMSKLQGDGYLLFSKEVFSLLIDGLISAVREGKLHLPVSRDKLAEIAGLSRPKPTIRVIELE
jgi:hypothetical protein